MRLPHKLLLAAPVLLLLYFFGLTRVGMLGPDEPRYASIGRDMARSGDWVTPRLWGEPWFEKPALLYWLVAIGHSTDLGDDLAPRLPVALVSVGFLVLYFSRMRREFGESAAWYATAMLATSAGWLVYSRVAVTDIPLAATFSASMLLALPWVRSGGRRGLVIAGVLLGLAVLAKGLVPLALAAPLLWVGRRRWADLAAMAAAVIVTAAPWYIAVWMQNGDAFVNEFIWRHHFGRFVSAELQHVQPWWFYLPVIAGLLFPWTPALFLLHRVDWREPRRTLLLGWALFGLLFFSASTNKLPGYLLPLLPAFTALMGIEMARVPSRVVPWAAAGLLCITPVLADLLPEAVASGLSRASLDSVHWLVVVLVIAAAAGVFAIARRKPDAAFATTTGLTAACVLYLIVNAFPHLDRIASARPRWLEIARTGDLPCPEGLHRSVRYGLHYYADRKLPPCTPSRERDTAAEGANHDILDRNRGVAR